MCLLWPYHREAMTQEHTCCMRSQSHERSWPPLFKLKFGNGWLTSKCCGSHCKKINSSFQFQFQFQGFQFQFHFQFHQFQFQFQFQFRNWNWNWPAIPIPELNWPQPWPWDRPLAFRWRHNDHAGVSNHQPHGCLLNRSFRRKSKKTSKLRVTGLCAGNSPGTGEFPAQMASYAENVSIWWRHHEILEKGIIWGDKFSHHFSCPYISLEWVRPG